MFAEIGRELFVILKLPGLRKDNSKVISTAVCSKTLYNILIIWIEITTCYSAWVMTDQ
jgi:hypothetical protein